MERSSKLDDDSIPPHVVTPGCRILDVIMDCIDELRAVLWILFVAFCFFLSFFLSFFPFFIRSSGSHLIWKALYSFIIFTAMADGRISRELPAEYLSIVTPYSCY